MIYNNPHGIMFHHFYDEKHVNGQGAISGSQLQQIISYYKKDHNILRADEWMNKAMSETLKNNDVCLTFDDALLCQYEIAAPILKEFDLTAFWFVYTSVIKGEIEMLELYRKFRTVYYNNITDFYNDFFSKIEASKYFDIVNSSLSKFEPEKYLVACPFYTVADKEFRFVRDQILGMEAYKEVMSLLMQAHKIDINFFCSDLWMNEYHLKKLFADGNIIGLHSHTHPTQLCKLSLDVQKKEYESNFNALRDILGNAPVSMSHPCNSYNDGTIDLLKELGIQLGFRANMENHNYSKFEFPREDHANIIGRIG